MSDVEGVRLTLGSNTTLSCHLCLLLFFSFFFALFPVHYTTPPRLLLYVLHHYKIEHID